VPGKGKRGSRNKRGQYFRQETGFRSLSEGIWGTRGEGLVLGDAEIRGKEERRNVGTEKGAFGKLAVKTKNTLRARSKRSYGGQARDELIGKRKKMRERPRWCYLQPLPGKY